MHILIETERFVAVDKPGGWLSVPSRAGASDARSCVGVALEKARGERLWPVHRLDEEVSGLLLFARDAATHRAASMAFERRDVHKTYEAWTAADVAPAPQLAPQAEPIPERGTSARWECRIARGKRRAYLAAHGDEAITVATPAAPPLAKDGAATLAQLALAWRLEPITGRAHQLRFELARHGCPILGDQLYGAAAPFLPGEIALRCVALAFGAAAQAAGLPARLEAPGLLAHWRSRNPARATTAAPHQPASPASSAKGS